MKEGPGTPSFELTQVFQGSTPKGGHDLHLNSDSLVSEPRPSLLH